MKLSVLKKVIKTRVKHREFCKKESISLREIYNDLENGWKYPCYQFSIDIKPLLETSKLQKIKIFYPSCRYKGDFLNGITNHPKDIK